MAYPTINPGPGNDNDTSTGGKFVEKIIGDYGGGG